MAIEFRGRGKPLRGRTADGSGAMNGVGNTSGIIGPVLTGVLIQQTGSYMAAFIVSAAIVGFGGIWWWVALPHVERLRLDSARLATL